MTFRYKLTKPIEKFNYQTWSISWSLSMEMPEHLFNMLQQYSCLVEHSPDAFFEPISNRLTDVWEYELTDQHKLLLDLAGAQTHDLWHRLFGKTLYIERRRTHLKEDTE